MLLQEKTDSLGKHATYYSSQSDNDDEMIKDNKRKLVWNNIKNINIDHISHVCIWACMQMCPEHLPRGKSMEMVLS